MSTHVVYQAIAPVCSGFICQNKTINHVFEKLRIRSKQKFKQDG